MRAISVVALWAESMVIFWTMGRVDAGAVLGVESQMQCTRLCVENPACCALSVSVTSEECRLSQHCLFYTEASEGWNTFNKLYSLCLTMRNGVSYTATRADAAPLCALYGGFLASRVHLDAAFHTGWDMCSYGWFDGGVCLISQKIHPGCQSMIGVYVGSRPSTDRINVYCMIPKGTDGPFYDCSDTL